MDKSQWTVSSKPTSDFFLEIAKWNIAWHRGATLTGDDNAIGTTEVTVWGIWGRYQFQTTVVAMEILSDDANDTSAWTWARTVLVEWLDINYAIQTETVTLNWVTPVALASNYLRINDMHVSTAWSWGVNVGTVTLRTVTGSVAQYSMLPWSNVWLTAVYTIPAWKTGYLLQYSITVEKWQDAVISVYRKPNWLFTRRLDIPVYQNTADRTLAIPQPLPAQTDLEVTAVSTNAGTSLFLQLLILLIDD